MVSPYIGQISMVAFNFPPRNWTFCSGQIISIASNTALFSLLGTAYGGDGRSTFGLPDLRGRVPIGSNDMGTGPGLSPLYRLGVRGGSETVTLETSELPKHTHEATSQGTLSNASAFQPAYNDNGNTLNPGPNVVPAIGNYTSGLTTTQINNYSTNNPNTNLKEVLIDGNITVEVSNENTGGDQAHFNMQPFTAINFVIALDGTYPPRN